MGMSCRQMYYLKQAIPNTPPQTDVGACHLTIVSERKYPAAEKHMPGIYPKKRRGEQVCEWPDCTDAVAPVNQMTRAHAYSLI